MTRGAGTTPDWVVPGAWPGSVVHGASPSVSQQSRFSDFLVGRDSSELLAAGGVENTNAVGVPPDVGTFFSISGGTCCTGPYLFFSGISACAFDGETKILLTDPLPKYAWCGFSGRQGPCGPRCRAKGWGRIPTVSSFSGVGFATFETSGWCEKILSRDCVVSCFVYAMERGTGRTTTGIVRGGAVDR